MQSRRGVAFGAWVLKAAYAREVARAGGQPLVVGPDGQADAGTRAAACCDGAVITGGAFDLPPAFSGATRSGRIDDPRPERTRFEVDLARACFHQRKPLFGVCGGLQLLAVLEGAALIGDIHAEVEHAGEHEQPTTPTEPWHTVTLSGWMATACGDIIQVNSTHHQAIGRLGPRVRVLGRSPDGIIEAADGGDDRWFGVQWHPELLNNAVSLALYRTLVQRA